MIDFEFRGKKYLNFGEWVFGDLLQGYDTKKFICHLYGMSGPVSKNIVVYEVDPKTVGRYIGQKDKNDVQIFDGDIFKYKRHEGYNVKSFVGWVLHHDTNPTYITKPYNLFDADEIEIDVLPYLKVIGNVSDNPQLLKSDVL